MPSSITAFVGLGSNLADPIRQIKLACEAIKHIKSTELTRQSPLYRSQAIGPEQPDFINAVAQIQTQLNPEELLDELQTIERAQGRERMVHWGPRTVDLDLLLYANQRIDTERLTVPHAELTQRNFVLLPLFDIAPQLTLPCGKPLEQVLLTCPENRIEPIND